MSAKYILRLDDACPTMDKKKWQKIENICDKYNIKPIVAVIPNNEDDLMKIDEYDTNFWNKVRNWQNKGWHIALHGYDHVYITPESGFLPFNKQSEFAGLSYESQEEKIKAGWKILQKEKIKCNIWVAPSHTFDKNTLTALEKVTNIKIISDGIALFPFKKHDFNWIPQQLWKFRKMPIGVWTACFHPNEITEIEILNLENFIKNNYQDFINIDILTYKNISILNYLFNITYLILFKIKRIKSALFNK